MKFITLLFLYLFTLAANAAEHEWFEGNHAPGASPTITDITDLSGPQIEARLIAMGGMYRTGRTKSSTWLDHRGYARSAQYIEVVYWDREDGIFVHGWQGYGDSKAGVVWRYRESIKGDQPKIQGSLYQP
jgi:hypothetical protein